MKKCKICGKKTNNKIYCSNKCKFSDKSYNSIRGKRKTNKDEILKCETCGWTTSDIYNYGGHATTHLKVHHNITDKDYLSYYIKKRKPKQKTFKCPYCNWTTVDLDNKSGWFTVHLKKKHNLSPEDHIFKFPDHKKLWQQYFKKKDYVAFINKSEDNRIKCEICGKQFKKLTYSHLSKHGITPTEYKDKFFISNTASNTTSLIQSEKTIALNKTLAEYYKEKNIPMPWHKSQVYEDKIKQNFKKYKIKNSGFKINFDYQTYWQGDSFNVTCKKCGKNFNSRNRDLRCYKCNPLLKGSSVEEKEIKMFIQRLLKSKDIIIENDRKILNGKELDIYLPDYKLAIEFNGLYWHSEIQGKDKNYHLNKTLLANSKGIRLIHIFSDEWLYKKDIVKNRLKHILNIPNKKIYARKCIIKEINTVDKNTFLDKYHIQGRCNSGNRLGAFYNNELVAVMTFGKLRKALGHTPKLNNYELIRFSTNESVVIGIASKLLTYFIRHYTPKKIITYADKRWSSSDNNLYTSIGFKKIRTSAPNYWYTLDNLTRLHRFNFRKSELVKKGHDVSKTENIIMKELGYNKIWDCGNMVYEWNE